MKVELDIGEFAVAQLLATMRHVVNRTAKVGNGKIGPQSDADTDLDGIVAELAFAKWRNVFPDLTLSPRSGGVDMVVRGKTVDVKATRHVNGRLLATISKSGKAGADVYVLGIVDGRSVTFVGWAFADELLTEDNVRDLGHGDTFAMEQSRLRKWMDA